MTKSKRQEIIRFKANHDWSYQLIADRFGVTRNQIAGILFRNRHPVSERVPSPNAKSKNKIGSGYRRGPEPAYTARDYQVGFAS